MDPKIHIKIMQKGLMVGSKQPWGPRNKALWFELYGARARLWDFANFTLIFDPSTSVVNWHRCGHYILQPDMPSTCDDPSEHKYTHLDLKLPTRQSVVA